MVRLVALLALAASPAPRGDVAAPPTLRLPASLAVRRPPGPPGPIGLDLPRARGAAGPRHAPAAAPPLCAADLCPAEPRYPGARVAGPARPGRTELFLRLLERSDLEPLASAAWFLQVLPLRVEWSPPTDGAGVPLPLSRGSLGKVTVSLKFRLDAHNRWTMPARSRP